MGHPVQPGIPFFPHPSRSSIGLDNLGNAVKGPVNIDTFAVQHRILGPGVAATVTRTLTNLFKGISIIKIPKGGIKSIVNANKAANPKPTNAPRTGPTVSSVAKAGIIGGSAVGTSIAFTSIIGDLTKPTPTGGTAGADVVKPIAESIGSFSGAAEGISSFVQSNPGTILLLGGGILLILLIK